MKPSLLTALVALTVLFGASAVARELREAPAVQVANSVQDFSNPTPVSPSNTPLSGASPERDGATTNTLSLAPIIDEGTLLAQTCLGCHREGPGNPDGIPSLRGLSVDEIAGKLLAYRSGELRGTLMNRLARGYSEGEIQQIANALGTIPKRGATTE